MASENPTSFPVSEHKIRWKSNVRAWTFAHEWSSLVRTPPTTPMANFDDITSSGRHMYPGQIVTSIFVGR
jgi:hypothetical protein